MLVTKQQQLRYELTSGELLELARNQARLFEGRNTAEEELTHIKADYKGRITLLDNEIQSSTRKIQAGYEMRNVEVLVLRYRPSTDEAIEVRLDTGECTAVRRLLTEEKQLTLVVEGNADEDLRYKWIAAIWWQGAPMQIPLTQMESDKLTGLVEMRPFTDQNPVALIGSGDPPPTPPADGKKKKKGE